MKSLMIACSTVLMLTAVSWGQNANSQHTAQSDYTAALQHVYQQAQGNGQGQFQSANQAYQQSLLNYNNLAQTQQQRALAYYELARGAQPSKYWVGVQCVPAGEVEILSDIPLIGNMFRRGGLRVNSITEKSPAAASDLEKGDVIILFNGKQVDAVDDLIAAIEEAGTKTCELKVVRASRFIDCTLTPAERPQSKENAEPVFWDGAKNYTYWRSNGKLPEDVQMTIIQEGPAEPFMVFKRGDDQWTIRDGQVAELPDDIELFAATVHGALQGLRQPYAPRYAAFLNATRSPYVYPTRATGNNQQEAINRLSEKVTELQAAIEALSKQID